jgi:hypothetical protein
MKNSLQRKDDALLIKELTGTRPYNMWNSPDGTIWLFSYEEKFKIMKTHEKEVVEIIENYINDFKERNGIVDEIHWKFDDWAVPYGHSYGIKLWI